MNPHIAQALEYLQKAYYAGYFEEMDKANIPAHLQTLYSEHKLAYMGGDKSFDFAQRLTVFAQEVGKTDSAPLPAQDEYKTLLLEKLAYFRKELAITANASAQFELKKRIEDIEKELNA